MAVEAAACVKAVAAEVAVAVVLAVAAVEAAVEVEVVVVSEVRAEVATGGEANRLLTARSHPRLQPALAPHTRPVCVPNQRTLASTLSPSLPHPTAVKQLHQGYDSHLNTTTD